MSAKQADILGYVDGLGYLRCASCHAQAMVDQVPAVIRPDVHPVRCLPHSAEPCDTGGARLDGSDKSNEVQS